MALGPHEAVMTKQVSRIASAHHGRYLTQLAACGYDLSDIERSVLGGLTEAEQDDEDDGGGA